MSIMSSRSNVMSVWTCRRISAYWRISTGEEAVAKNPFLHSSRKGTILSILFAFTPKEGRKRKLWNALKLCLYPKNYAQFLEKLLEKFDSNVQPIRVVELLCLLGQKTKRSTEKVCSEWKKFTS